MIIGRILFAVFLLNLLFACEGIERKAETNQKESIDVKNESPSSADIYSEEEIEAGRIPSLVRQVLEEKYNEMDIIQVEEITDFDGNVVYDILLKKDNKNIKASVDANGNFLKEEFVN